VKIGFSIVGSPVTKKNHGRRIWRHDRPFHVPSKAHEEWYANAACQAYPIKADIRAAGVDLPITGPITVRATIYRERAYRADECGYMQALGDWLQGVGIIENDEQIHWGGVRLAKDAEKPRIEVEISIS
jgi:Holliday junction resolvase RusA-like endonuclease